MRKSTRKARRPARAASAAPPVTPLRSDPTLGPSMAPPHEPQRSSSPRAAPAVEQGTALDKDEALRERWQEQLLAAKVDPALWSGAFATNVWGGRYEMDGVLGHGGQGATFAGTDRKTGARVAVKVLDLKHAADWKRVELFEREARVLRDVEHEGMPAFIDVLEDKDSGARALVMSLVQGRPLDVVTRGEGSLGEPALWRTLIDVTQVLAALHSRDVPVIHRDLKPRNLVRRPDGRVCVVDFGGVGARGQGGSTVVGTFGYMAPEQLYGSSSPATDIYSLGATLLALATGKEPEDLPRAGLSLDVDKAAPHLSEPLRRILKRMVAPDPSERPADARALTGELTRLASEDTKQAQQDKWEDKSSEDDFALGEGKQDDVNEAMQVIAAIVRLLIGVLGTVATVVIGEVLLPIAFTIAGAFTSGVNKERVERAKGAVSSATKLARKGFERTAQEGAKELEAIGERDKRRKRRLKGKRKEARNRAKERHKEERSRAKSRRKRS